MVSLKQAAEHIANIPRLQGTEIVPLENCLSRVIAQDIFANICMPRFNNSAMDGYAVFYEDAKQEVIVVGEILAGTLLQQHVDIQRGQALRVTTGAMIPLSANCIVPKEQILSVGENKIILPSTLEEFANIRFIGEDIRLGELLISNGDVIDFSKITLLAAQGITHIEVYKKVVIAVFSSGEELKPHWENALEHQIYNSNTPTLIARANELGCNVMCIPNARDSIISIQEAIQNSLFADVIVTSGGVSVGEADFTNEAFASFDFEEIFAKVNLKPGKPVVFGRIGKTFVLNLPGNPLAGTLVFELLGKILLAKLSGRSAIYPFTIQAKLSEEIFSKEFYQIVPGYFDGGYFTPATKRNPGMVNVLSHCNCMMIIDCTCNFLPKDSEIQIILFDSILYKKSLENLFSK